ncbi:PAS domain-containing sensor histidine kinase [Fodinisporobacter ferrooxydans]|uniref:Sensor histidine kinase n=1 Tax=Fodinisporobacter ferrooxydans TaxID=2901836 RepID=A0ABY4CS75_9BACL|nr:PAS domain-containing sensor histidine kinase [Alicyclobacillaceae bacterium MYW30-H2]
MDTIFQNISDGMLVVDREGIIVGANRAAEKMTGYSSDEMVGRLQLCDVCLGMATCYEEKSCVDCFAKKLKVSSFEMRLRTRRGQEIPVTASSTRMPDHAMGALVVILRDMSEQKRVERERFQRITTNHVIQAQEEERKRVSRDLHDGVGQALYSIVIGLQLLQNQVVNEDVKNYLEDVHQMTIRALEEVKSLAVELRPSALDDLGLIPAIRSYSKRFEQTFGIETELEVSGPMRRYASSVETALYRICQEAMTNAVKYADTDKIHIRLRDEGHLLELQIADKGQGFDVNQIEIQGTGLGLYGMSERAHLLGGQLDIQSSIGEGTCISVSVPLSERGEPIYENSHIDRG